MLHNRIVERFSTLDYYSTMKKIVKISLLILVLLFTAAGITLGVYFAGIWSKVSTLQLNNDALTSPSLTISLYDSENKPIKEENMFNGNYVKAETLPEHTLNAFVSIEDKTFYQHKGVNYKRIAKAAFNNLKSRSLKEGASTISQQLIKNTHLSSEKTYERKLKEIALTSKLEKAYSKKQILEMYLNVIYFGNNCYGIESASNYYFSKSAHDLNLEESATLAGMIKSPNYYSPVNNPERCLKRRNLVLDEMEKDGIITLQERLKSQATPIKLDLNVARQNKLNSYSEACIDEAQKVLGLPAKQIALGGYKIYTYLNENKQQSLEKAIEDCDTQDNDHAGIVIDNARSAIVAYTGESAYKILDARRQPGSCIKPVLVYAPALNEDIIYPCTQLLDEPTTISGYSPKNVGGKYSGYVSARTALSKSINIPAVKVLSYVGIDKAKSYASQMGIEFDEKDDSFALALGGMNYGTDIASLAGAYSTFARGGSYSTPKFISYITDARNKLIYIHKPENKTVLREDACYLLTDMLKTCATAGTARKLSDLGMEIASKTGTVGKPGSKENLDAWNISYTKDYTCGVWIGNLDNSPITITGGNTPTQIVKNYFISQPDNSHFNKPSSITEENIDSQELAETHRIILANNFCPECYTQTEIFSRFNLPSDISKRFVEIEEPQVKTQVVSGKAFLTFEAKDYMTYEIYKGSTDRKNRLSVINGKKGKQIMDFIMDSDREKFFIVSSLTNSPDRSRTKEIELIKTKKTSSNQKWYI